MSRHRTVDRVAAILEFAAAESDQGITLASVAQRLDAPKSSLHGLIGGLLQVGYLTERNGRYVIGPGLGMLVGSPQTRTIADVASDELRRLLDETGETVLLGLRVGDAVVYIEQLESPHSIRYSAPTHEPRPMTTTSMGKLYLAEQDEREVRRIARAEGADAARLAALQAELAEVRRRGYSTNYLVMEAGIVALAAALRDQHDQIVAAMAVRGPTFRMGAAEVEAAATLLIDAAARVSDQLTRR